MGKIIVITSGKGGVGKTTTASGLGTALSERGRSVVLVDADIGLRNLDILLGLEDNVVYDLVDVVKQKCRLGKALIRDKRQQELWFLPASQTMEQGEITPEEMRELCDTLREKYDYVIIDCPAGIEQGFLNAVAAADCAVLVTTPEKAAVRDADRVVAKLEELGIEDRLLIINRMRGDMVRRGNMLSSADIIDMLATKLLAVVPEDERVIAAAASGAPVTADKKSRAGMAYKNAARRLEGETVPLLAGKEKRSFFRKKKF